MDDATAPSTIRDDLRALADAAEALAARARALAGIATAPDDGVGGSSAAVDDAPEPLTWRTIQEVAQRVMGRQWSVGTAEDGRTCVYSLDYPSDRDAKVYVSLETVPRTLGARLGEVHRSHVEKEYGRDLVRWLFDQWGFGDEPDPFLPNRAALARFCAVLARPCPDAATMAAAEDRSAG